MRIFLTGINGFLASHVAIKLVDCGYKVVGLIRSKSVNILLQGLEIDFVYGDINNPSSYIDNLKKCDVVIHCAGVSDFNIRDIDILEKVNFHGTKNVLESCNKYDVDKFIHISTRGILGTNKIPENSNEYTTGSLDTFDSYKLSKYKAEEFVNQNFPNIQKSIIYPTALIGSNDLKPTSIGNIMMNSVYGKNLIYLDGGINVVDVQDVAQGIINIIKQKRYNQNYILGGYNILLKDLFDLLSNESNSMKPLIKVPYKIAYFTIKTVYYFSVMLKIKIIVNPYKVYSLYNKLTYCSSQKAQNEIDYQITNLHETVTKIVHFYKNQ